MIGQALLGRMLNTYARNVERTLQEENVQWNFNFAYGKISLMLIPLIIGSL